MLRTLVRSGCTAQDLSCRACQPLFEAIPRSWSKRPGVAISDQKPSPRNENNGRQEWAVREWRVEAMSAQEDEDRERDGL